MKMHRRKKSEKGFTLMEIIIVFILLGILAVAVIPTFTQMEDVGYKANQEGTNAALKTAWTVAYAEVDGGGNPTLDQIAALVTGDDGTVCSCLNGDITCNGILSQDGTSSATFGMTNSTSCASTVSSPSLIVITGS